MAEFLQVTTVAHSKELAESLAQSAVAARLAASAQVFGPVQSFFWHEGNQGDGQEWQVVLKTTVGRYAELQEHLLTEHAWDNPEISAVRIEYATDAYLDWLSRTMECDS